MKAVYAEHDALKERQVFRIVSRRAVHAAGIKPIGSRLVLHTKYNKYSKRIKEKARIVAKGYTQEEGINLFETYADVAGAATVCLFVAVATGNNLLWGHIDVSTAFLYSPMEETVYLEPPEPFNAND